MARDTWYRLDNIGSYYASEAPGAAQAVFRYAATLADEVDPAILQDAVEKTVKVFPGFNVCKRSGLFWHYLQQVDDVPRVVPECLPVCYGLHTNVRSVLFRVTFHGCRINFEVSHMVSDGRGSLGFFKTLLYAYLRERYAIADLPLTSDASTLQKFEDSYHKYFEPEAAGSQRMPRPYRLAGWRDASDPTFFEYHIPVRAALDLAHGYGVSLTALLVAVLAMAIRDGMPPRERTRPIRVEIPVDLRQFFKSTTAKNFFGLAFVDYVPGASDEPVEVVARKVSQSLAEATEVTKVKARMNRMVAFEKNPFMRVAPVFLKDAVLGVASRFAGRGVTATLSNLGAIKLDERVSPYVRDVDVLSSTEGLRLTVASYGGDLSIGFATVFSNPEVVRSFCRFFSERGVEGRMNVNKTAGEVAENRLEADFEESVKRLVNMAPELTAHADGPDGAEGRGR